MVRADNCPSGVRSTLWDKPLCGSNAHVGNNITWQPSEMCGLLPFICQLAHLILAFCEYQMIKVVAVLVLNVLIYTVEVA